MYIFFKMISRNRACAAPVAGIFHINCGYIIHRVNPVMRAESTAPTESTHRQATVGFSGNNSYSQAPLNTAGHY